MQRCSSEGAEAFGDLYDRHSAHVYRFLRRLCGQDSDAEDLLQDAFVAAYQRLGDWRGEGQFATWLCGIAFRQYLASRRRGAIRQTEPLDDEMPASVDECPWVRLDRANLAARLETAVEALPDGLREVVVLVKIEGLSYREAAEWLELPLGTVQSRLWRGVRRLQRSLADLCPASTRIPVIAAPEPGPVSVSTLPTKEIL